MKEKANVKQMFSKTKDNYISSSTHSNKEDLNRIVNWLNPGPQMIALDIATGGGHVAKTIARHVKRVIATDITKPMLENTAKHLAPHKNIDYVIADAEQLPFLDSTFDLITCRIAPHHFPNPNQFIFEVHRVLKPKGKFMMIDNIASEQLTYDHFINTLEKMRDYSHVRSLKISEWKQLLKKNQLNIVQQETRKKKLPFDEWVNRTLDTDDEKRNVSQFILNATAEVKQYYQVEIINHCIQSFTIDEWTVLCEK